MKTLLAILLLLPLSVAAQEQPPQVMTEQEAVMLEWSQATVMQLMCVVHYENLGVEANEDKIEVFAIAPLAHGAQHGIPAQYVAQVVAGTLPQIREQWDQLPAERAAQVPQMCEQNLEVLIPVVEGYKKWLDEQEAEKQDPVMNIPTESI